MQKVVISMVRNERDIIRSFAEHVTALFDRLVIIDHGSTDGTREYLEALGAAHPGKVSVYHFDEPGYFQSELITWMARHVAASHPFDWIFILDADEFLPFADREAFRQALSEHSASPVIAMPWRNAAAGDFDADGVLEQRWWVSSSTSRHAKVAFQPALIDLSSVTVTQGNHALRTVGRKKRVHSKKAFDLYHLPIRSKAQLTLKLLQGLIAHERMGSGRADSANYHYHWYEMVGYIKQHGITDELMRGLALRYGERIKDKGLPYPTLREDDYDTRRPALARTDLGVAVEAREEENASLVVALAEALCQPSRATEAEAGWHLVLGEGNRIGLEADVDVPSRRSWLTAFKKRTSSRR